MVVFVPRGDDGAFHAVRQRPVDEVLIRRAPMDEGDAQSGGGQLADRAESSRFVLDLRQGVTAGLLRCSLEKLDALPSAVALAHLEAAAGRTLTPEERGANRAAIFRDFTGALTPGRL